MNSSRISLLVIFSLLLACFTSSALCTLTWREGDVYTVSVIDSTGATAVRSNVTISEGSGDYTFESITVTLDSENVITVQTGSISDEDFSIHVAKVTSDSLFSVVTIIGESFEGLDSSSVQLNDPTTVAISLSGATCFSTCDITVAVSFIVVPEVAITSVFPRTLPVIGGPITISGTGFNFTTPTTVTISKGSKSHPCVITNIEFDTIICKAAEGVSKGYTLTVNVANAVIVTAPVAYGEPFVTGTRTSYADWAAFVYISGGNFNPHNLYVELTQGSNRKRSLTHPVCVVVAATTTQITCSVTGLITGPLSAVITTNGYATGNNVPKNVGNVVVASAFTPTSSASCFPPSGTPDIYQTDMCNCWSGYAPSDESASNCDTHAKCAQKLLGDQDFFGNDIPQQPVTSFADDTLTIEQEVGIVQNRRSTFISFRVPKLNHTLPALAPGTQGALTCNYPGVLWKKSLNTLDCKEVFTAQMPWSQNQFCGFVQDLDATTQTTAVYKAVLSTEYIEVFRIDGALSQRMSLYSYQVHVSFLTQKAISSANINIYLADPSVIGFVQVSVVGDAVYDAASGNVLVSFLTTSAWPYQLDATNPSFLNSVPVFSGMSVDIANLDYLSGSCDTTQDSACQQKWYVRISTGGNCDITGVYTFHDTLMCRDVNSTEEAMACPDSPDPVQFSVRIKNTDLCDPTALDATAQMTTELTPFFDSQFTTPTDTFQTGDFIYWRFAVTNPQGTVDRIAFNHIEIDLVDGGADVILDLQNITATGSAVELSTKNVDTITSAGSTATLFFQHKLLRSALVNTVGTLTVVDPDAQTNAVSLSVTVVVDIWYHGNAQKRTVHLTNDGAAQAANTHSVYVINNGEVEDLDEMKALSNILGTKESSAVMTSSSIIAIILALLALML